MRRLAITVSLAGVVVSAIVWFLFLQTYHFATVTPGVLYRDGNRGVRELSHAVERHDVRTVISLVDDRELADPAKPQFAAEAEYCRGHGIKQIRIPVTLGGWPSPADVRQFLSVVNDPANQPVLVHCAQGVRRTGMFVAAYQLSTLHEPPERVKAQVLTFGHKPRDVDDVRTFIDRYDPVTQSLPTTLPASTEK